MKNLYSVIFIVDTLWGKKQENKKVKKGFANWLIKSNKAVPLNKFNISRIEREQSIVAQITEEIYERSKVLKEKIDNIILSFFLQKNKKGVYFGSIKRNDILNELKTKGIFIKKSQLLESKPLNTPGLSIVHVKIIPDVIANLQISIS